MTCPGPGAPARPVLVVVCGLPGSGKTTLARRLETERDLVRLSPDEDLERSGESLWDLDARARVVAEQRARALDLLSDGRGVVVEWGSWFRDERDALRADARRRGATVELLVLDAADEELWRRIRERGREQPPIRLDHVTTWRELFEQPDDAELARYDVGRRVPS